MNWVHDNSGILVRRCRLKFDGWAMNSKLKYKLELGISNRDISGGPPSEFSSFSNIVLDAYIEWQFYKNASLRFGQGKLPGNRERVISSANLQFVDRSILNARFNIDRDVGIMLINKHTLFSDVVLHEFASVSQGEGRNVTSGYHNGFDYTFRVECYPLGEFHKNGAYIASCNYQEETPKLAVGITYSYNEKAQRERGQLGKFIDFESTNITPPDLQTVFVDLMFKYMAFSVMAEYAYRDVDSNPILNDDNDVLGTYYTGSALNLQAGYIFIPTWEISARYSKVSPAQIIHDRETQFTFGLSKYIQGHKLKIQTDCTYSDIENSQNKWLYRLQMELHI